MSENTDHSLSITPPSKMNTTERVGLTLAGIGLLALLIAFTAASIPPYISMGIGWAFMVAGGTLLSKDREKYRNAIYLLFGAGAVSLTMMALVEAGVLDLANSEMSKGEGGIGNWVYWLIFFVAFAGTSAGAVMYFYGAFGKEPAGIKNNGNKHSEATRKQGSLAWMMAILFTGFYVALYWFPETVKGLSEVVKPLKVILTGNGDNAHWFLYGLIYTLAILVMGARMFFKYRHNRYQLIRTGSVMFFQLVIAFTLPSILEMINTQQSSDYKPVKETYKNEVFADYKMMKDSVYNLEQRIAEKKNVPALEQKLEAAKARFTLEKDTARAWQDTLRKYHPNVTAFYYSYFWPLDYDILFPSQIKYYAGEDPKQDGVLEPWQSVGFGSFGIFTLLFAFGMSTVGVVALTYFFGKRWYCSWVCGCGGLAETAGDPFRHLSDKSLDAWRVERILIHSVLLAITLVTVILLVNWIAPFMSESLAGGLKKGYGFVIGMTFIGVVGTGFYPLLGNRVWCRFGCPQAAVLGILQKYFSRFRITTNGGQCISCGNCSTYCEMGIDVKWYAQRGQNIIRASCVGCGICSAVCPRGVLNLENGPKDTRYNGENPVLISKDKVEVSK